MSIYPTIEKYDDKTRFDYRYVWNSRNIQTELFDCQLVIFVIKYYNNLYSKTLLKLFTQDNVNEDLLKLV